MVVASQSLHMAVNNIPPALKGADLVKFASVAAQVRSIRPEVAYWCEMRMLNQIISQGLHTTNSECLQYTTRLMDKLEETKAENSTNDAIVDNAAGQAYIEQFALEIFQKAENAVQANSVTARTAETFQAAATFLQVLKEWGDLDAEIQAKIKYAKWNALRILKAIKEGRDPNESNPRSQPTPEEILPTLDPDDPDVVQFSGGGETKSRQATVEDAPDEHDRVESHAASARPAISPASQSTFEPHPRECFPYTVVTTNNDVSPPDPSPNPRNGSLGGGYFPSVPTTTSDPSRPHLPSVPCEDAMDIEPPPDLPDPPPPGLSTGPDFSSFPPPDIKDPYPDDETEPSLTAPPQNFYRQEAPPPPLHPTPSPLPPQYLASPPPSLPPSSQQPSRAPPPATAAEARPLNPDEEAIAQAQKHARWAISALNFEDAETAVRELRAALASLGAPS